MTNVVVSLLHRMLAFSRSEECRTSPARHRISCVAPKCWAPWLLDVLRGHYELSAVLGISPPSLCPLLVFQRSCLQ